MTSWVVDASVIVKRFIPEVNSAYAVNLFNSIDADFFAPDLAVSEFGNILRKKVRRGELSKGEGIQVLNAFNATPIEWVDAVPFTAATFEIACTFDRTFYDCLYLAIAVDLDCMWVTADEKFYNALSNSSWAKYLRLLKHL